MSVCLIALALTLCMSSGERAPAAVESAAPVARAEIGATATPGAAAAPAAPVEDRWLAEDKLRHFALSFAATQMGYGGGRFALDPDPAVAVAAATAVGLGIAKEVRDLRLGGPFSLKDLTWDAAGAALGVLLVRRIR